MSIYEVNQTNRANFQALLEEIGADTLRSLMPAMIAITWLWAASMEFVDESLVVQSYAVLGWLLVVSAVTYWLFGRRYRLATGVYLWGLWGMVAFMESVFQEPMIFFVYLLLVLMAAAVSDLKTMWRITGGCILIVWFRLAFAPGGQPGAEYSLAMGFILLTGVVTWLSSRRLIVALSWLTTMSAKAQENAEEAREHRAELQRVMQTLTNAHVMLEKSNRALIFAQEVAEKAYNFKSEFVANVSHELRTPLNLIVGFSEMAVTAPESYGGVLLPKEYRGDMMAIYRSAQHLLDLINDVLDLSQIEAGRLPIVKKPVELQSVLNEAADIVRGLADARNIELQLDLPEQELILDLDRTRIRQVLLNLLTNAMRFTDEGWVRIETRHTGDAVDVMVRDTGRGIEPESLSRAFEAFSQLDEEQAYGGTGLGLAVSKRFVQLHGGHMWINSELGVGTVVGFSLPLMADETTPAQSNWRRNNPARQEDYPFSILVVHEDRSMLDLLHRHLDGFEFILATDAEEAATIAAEELPRAVIIDAQVVHRWKEVSAEQPWLEATPVVACPLPNARHWGRIIGVADYLPKPVTRTDLNNALARLPSDPEKILIVDDNPHVVRLLSRMLRADRPGAIVLEAFGGREGLEIVRSQGPDVVLLDLMMPEVSGYDFLDEIKRGEACMDLQVILVSVRSAEQESAPLSGTLAIERGGGFSLTEMLAILQQTLNAITGCGSHLGAAATSPTSAAAILESQFG